MAKTERWVHLPVSKKVDGSDGICMKENQGYQDDMVILVPDAEARVVLVIPERIIAGQY